MFVVYVDLEQTGRSKPVPCAQFKPVELWGDGWYKLVGVEQIKELARPTMEVSELIIQRKHIEVRSISEILGPPGAYRLLAGHMIQ